MAEIIGSIALVVGGTKLRIASLLLRAFSSAIRKYGEESVEQPNAHLFSEVKKEAIKYKIPMELVDDQITKSRGKDGFND
jgi:hypothetical protein